MGCMDFGPSGIGGGKAQTGSFHKAISHVVKVLAGLPNSLSGDNVLLVSYSLLPEPVGAGRQPPSL